MDEIYSYWDAIEGRHCADHDDAGKYLRIHQRKAGQFTAEVILIEGRNSLSDKLWLGIRAISTAL